MLLPAHLVTEGIMTPLITTEVHASVLSRRPRQATKRVAIPPRRVEIKIIMLGSIAAPAPGLAAPAALLRRRGIITVLVLRRDAAVSAVLVHEPDGLLLVPAAAGHPDPLPAALPDAVPAAAAAHDVAEVDAPRLAVPQAGADQEQHDEPEHGGEADVQRHARGGLGRGLVVDGLLGDEDAGALVGGHGLGAALQGGDGQRDVDRRGGLGAQDGRVDGPLVEGPPGLDLGRLEGLVEDLARAGVEGAACDLDGRVALEEGRVPGY